jgi:hypothetical protein
MVDAIAWAALVLGLLALAAAAYIRLPGGRERLETALRLPAFAPIDFARLRKTARPNQFLVLPAGHGVEAPDLVAPTFDVPAERLAELWRTRAAIGPDVAERHWDPATLTVDHVERTPLMRYPDLVTARFIALDAARSTLAVYSRSVYGYGDRGVNRRRVRLWLGRLSEAVNGG